MKKTMPPAGDSARSLTLDDLLREAELARPLAARLVRDAAAADDLVQEAVMVALTSAQAVRQDAGRWFRGIVRNQARQLHRGEGNRSGREREAASPEGVAAADEPVAAAERQKDLLEAVLELPPASREVVLLRFYENLPPRKIAARLGESGPTVKKRLERGLGQLRLALEKRYGDRGAWAVALLPLCRSELGSAAAFGGAASKGASLKALAAGASGARSALALVALTLLIGFTGWYAVAAGSAAAPEQADLGLALLEAPAAPDAPRPALEDESSAGRSAAAPPAEPDDPSASAPDAALAPASAPGLTTEIRLIGIDGLPLAGEALTWVEAATGERRASLKTDENGWLRVEGFHVPSYTTGYWLVRGAPWQRMGINVLGDRREVRMIVPAVQVSGVVLDEAGEPAPGATVRWISLASAQGDVADSVRGSFRSGMGKNVESDQDGRFDLGYLPAAGRSDLRAKLGRSQSAATPSPPSSTRDLTIRLGPTPPASRTLRGVVLDTDGQPAPGVSVRFAWLRAQTDHQGQFAVGVPPVIPGRTRRVSAQHGDGRWCTTETDDLKPILASTDPWLQLELPASMRSVRVRLVGRDGEEAESYRSQHHARFLDGTQESGSTAALEKAAFKRCEDGTWFHELSCLADRTYRVRFSRHDPLSVVDVTINSAAATPNVVEVPLPGEQEYREVNGVVVDPSGLPLAGIPVSLMIESDLYGKFASGSPSVKSENTVTGADGRFRFSRVPKNGIQISAKSLGVISSARVADLAPDESARIELDVQVEVFVTAPMRNWDSISAVDAAGNDLRIRSRRPGQSAEAWRIQVRADGTLPQIFISARTRALLLNRRWNEVRRIPVSPVPGEPIRLDL